MHDAITIGDYCYRNKHEPMLFQFKSFYSSAKSYHVCAQTNISSLALYFRRIIFLKNPASDFMKLVFAVWSFGVV